MMREALEAMVWQFAYRTLVDGRRSLTTIGLSALEDAFVALGWEDPHFVTEAGCDIKDCGAWATCVGAYPRSLARDVSDEMRGFGCLCANHWRKWNGQEAEPAEDLGREAPASPG
jgi:hypothetical protein